MFGCERSKKGEIEARGGDDCGQVWIDGDLLFGALAIAGALYAYYLYVTITMKGRRRKKRSETRNDLDLWNVNLFLGKYIQLFCQKPLKQPFLCRHLCSLS